MKVATMKMWATWAFFRVCPSLWSVTSDLPELLSRSRAKIRSTCSNLRYYHDIFMTTRIFHLQHCQGWSSHETRGERTSHTFGELALIGYNGVVTRQLCKEFCYRNITALQDWEYQTIIFDIDSQIVQSLREHWDSGTQRERDREGQEAGDEEEDMTRFERLSLDLRSRSQYSGW